MKHKFFGFLAAALFAVGSLNAMSVDVGLGVGVVPDIFSANTNVWAKEAPFAYTNENSYAGEIAKDSEFFTTTSGTEYTKLAYNSLDDFSRSYKGSNGLVGMSVGLVARMKMDNLFFRVGVDYAFVVGGGTIENSETVSNAYAFNTGSSSWVATGQSASYTAKVSISGYILSIPLTVIGINIPTKVAGKNTVFYGGIGPSILMGKMTRKLEMSSGGYAATMAQNLGMTDSTAELTYSATALGFHWVVGAQAEVAPQICVGFEVIGTKGGKVVSKTITDSYSSTDPYASYKSSNYLDVNYTDYISNATANYTSTSGTTTTKTVGAVQTLNMSDVRMNVNVSYRVM